MLKSNEEGVFFIHFYYLLAMAVIDTGSNIIENKN
jgi:hypothetical protein